MNDFKNFNFKKRVNNYEQLEISNCNKKNKLCYISKKLANHKGN